MLVFIAGLAVAFFVFRALGARRSGGILRRAFWCCYVLWAPLVVYSLVYSPWKAIRAQDETFVSPLSIVDSQPLPAQPAAASAPDTLPANFFDNRPVANQGNAGHGTYTAADVAPASEQPTQPSPIQWEWAIGFLAGPLVLYRMVVFVVQG